MYNKLNIGVDAINISEGGGLVHLKSFINVIAGSENVSLIIWSSEKTLSVLPDAGNIKKKTNHLINSSLFFRMLWKTFCFDKELKRYKIDVLWDVTGIYFGSFHPYVSMSRNMLIWEKSEAKRFDLFYRLKLMMLRFVQAFSFNRADGLLFLSKYAREKILSSIRRNNFRKETVIPHGRSHEFIRYPPSQKNIDVYSKEKPFRFLYVSHISLYKHQWNVVEAVSKLREEGFPVEILFVGGKQEKAWKKFCKSKEKNDFYNKFVSYEGFVSHEKIVKFYFNSDMFLFASTCENLPNTLIEAMSSGLPIIASEYGPMKEVARDSAEYFDPESVESIVDACKKMLLSSEKRVVSANKAWKYSQNYSWKRTAEDTISYLRKVHIYYHDKVSNK